MRIAQPQWSATPMMAVPVWSRLAMAFSGTVPRQSLDSPCSKHRLSTNGHLLTRPEHGGGSLPGPGRGSRRRILYRASGLPAEAQGGTDRDGFAGKPPPAAERFGELGRATDARRSA